MDYARRSFRKRLQTCSSFSQTNSYPRNKGHQTASAIGSNSDCSRRWRSTSLFNKNGNIMGVEAVIDKDLASAQLAIDIKADKFIILTNVKQCYLNYKKRTQLPIKEMNLDEALTYLEQGQFSSGSMGPKVQAAIDYITNSGKEAYITDIENVLRAIEKEAGTFIYH